MEDGKYTIYCIQHRQVAKNTWCKRESPLKRIVPLVAWHFSNWDSFGKEIRPWKWKGNSIINKYPKLTEESDKVRSLTGHSGFFTLKYAMDSLVRLREADDRGAFDTYDGYKVYHQSVRHEFRVVKLELFHKTSVVCEMRTPWTQKGTLKCLLPL